MTDIDTAAIRAEYVQTRHSQVDVTIGALCDALDAARVVQDLVKYNAGERERGLEDQRLYWKARAEAAEANLREWKARSDLNLLRAEAAEAELAECNTVHIRALTGDTHEPA